MCASSIAPVGSFAARRCSAARTKPTANGSRSVIASSALSASSCLRAFSAPPTSSAPVAFFQLAQVATRSASVAFGSSIAFASPIVGTGAGSAAGTTAFAGTAAACGGAFGSSRPAADSRAGSRLSTGRVDGATGSSSSVAREVAAFAAGRWAGASAGTTSSSASRCCCSRSSIGVGASIWARAVSGTAARNSATGRATRGERMRTGRSIGQPSRPKKEGTACYGRWPTHGRHDEPFSRTGARTPGRDHGEAARRGRLPLGPRAGSEIAAALPARGGLRGPRRDGPGRLRLGELGPVLRGARRPALPDRLPRAAGERARRVHLRERGEGDQRQDREPAPARVRRREGHAARPRCSRTGRS